MINPPSTLPTRLSMSLIAAWIALNSSSSCSAVRTSSGRNVLWRLYCAMSLLVVRGHVGPRNLALDPVQHERGLRLQLEALDLAERVAPQRELPVPRQQLPPRKLASVELEGVVQRVVGPHFDRVRERERPVVVAFDAQVEPVIARQLKVERDAVQHRAPAGRRGLQRATPPQRRESVARLAVAVTVLVPRRTRRPA